MPSTNRCCVAVIAKWVKHRVLREIGSAFDCYFVWIAAADTFSYSSNITFRKMAVSMYESDVKG